MIRDVHPGSGSRYFKNVFLIFAGEEVCRIWIFPRPPQSYMFGSQKMPTMFVLFRKGDSTDFIQSPAVGKGLPLYCCLAIFLRIRILNLSFESWIDEDVKDGSEDVSIW